MAGNETLQRYIEMQSRLDLMDLRLEELRIEQQNLLLRQNDIQQYIDLLNDENDERLSQASTVIND